MNDPGSSEKAQTLFEDRLLRREAGDGWHPVGLNEQLLGALVLREQLLDEIVEKQNEVYDDERARMWGEYMAQVEEVNRLKGIFSIDDPPPMEISSIEE